MGDTDSDMGGEERAERFISHAYGMGLGLAIGGGAGMVEPIAAKIAVVGSLVVYGVAYLLHRSLNSDTET